MSSESQSPGSGKESLRVALDDRAARAYAAMVDQIERENSDVKINPSAFISFLVQDFHTTYFEKDLGVYVAEFFDAKSFYENEIRRSKNQGDYEQVMSGALVAIKKIKAKRRCKAVRRRNQKRTGNLDLPHEKV